MQKLCRSYAEVGAVCVKDSSGGVLCAAVALGGTDVGLGVSGGRGYVFGWVSYWRGLLGRAWGGLGTNFCITSA